jgi:hypothetical protein
MPYVPLPKVVANKKAIINVQIKDNKCFLWAILLALHPADDHSNRVSKYKNWENESDEALKGIEFPVKLSDVSKFAKRTNISINCTILTMVVRSFGNNKRGKRHTYLFVIL